MKRQLKRPKILLGLAVTLALVISAFAMATPVMAQPIPPEANTNSIGIGISVPAGTYYYGDTIQYTVIVNVPGPTPPIYPAQQINIDAWLRLPDETEIFLGTIPVLNPGESYVFPAESYVIDPLDVEEVSLLEVVVAEAWCDGTAQLDPPVPSGADVQIATPVVYEELMVSKTVETSYIRTHLWDIEKWVETEYGHTIEDDIPKIWLYEDGSGDETATWHVCVDYLGYEDSDFNVSGTVTIENTGTSDAVITDVEDLLCGTPITVDFGVGFPYTLEPGDTLVGTYSEDVFCDGLNEVTVTTEMDEYYTSEPVVWGDPDEEFLDVVDIEDDSDLFGIQLLGTLYAADYVEGDVVCFTYDHYFAWTDYSAPGPYTYENIATIVQTGQWDDAILVVNWLEEELMVTKTVETSYTRTHLWDIEKWVETDYGHTIEEDIPKIWLYEDGSGDEWATWWVCVTYLGYEDSDFNVSGTVTIENTGTSDAVITGVEDLLCGTPIDVDFGGVTFPYTLVVGDTLVGTYDEDVAGMLLDCDNEVTVTTEVDVYGTSEPVVWGDPDEEFLDVVDIEDDSDLFGIQLLGTLYAADYVEGDVVCFTYDHYFAWTDYSAPGPYTYENIATIVQTGQWDDAILVVNWLEEELMVTKTVETSYTRTHLWDIEKWVETDYGHTIEEDIPKIWLYEDESGDEWATWHVCVDYLGYEDSDFNVSGTVTIENTGTEDAVITGVEDLLCGTPIDVDFGGVTFPYTLGVGDTLVGTYDEDVFCDGLNEVTVTTLVDVYGTDAPVTWGDPEEEYFECVDIEDDSDLFGTQYLGTLCAPNSDCFTYDEYFAWADYFAPGPYTYENIATIVQTGQWDDAILVVNWEQPGDEGCTPGFWKNNAVNWEAVAWEPTGYDPGDSFESVFGVSDITLRGKGKDTIEHPTLLEALSANGGGINALARHAVAALLNISHPDIAYAGGMNVAGLIAAVQDAIAMDGEAIEALHIELAGYNEAGCSIDQHGNPIIPEDDMVF